MVVGLPVQPMRMRAGALPASLPDVSSRGV